MNQTFLSIRTLLFQEFIAALGRFEALWLILSRRYLLLDLWCRRRFLKDILRLYLKLIFDVRIFSIIELWTFMSFKEILRIFNLGVLSRTFLRQAYSCRQRLNHRVFVVKRNFNNSILIKELLSRLDLRVGFLLNWSFVSWKDIFCCFWHKSFLFKFVQFEIHYFLRLIHVGRWRWIVFISEIEIGFRDCCPGGLLRIDCIASWFHEFKSN